jgi:hypothetical protein
MPLTLPVLKTGAVYQYPLVSEIHCSTTAVRFVDGKEQRFETRGRKRAWILRFSQLEENELAELEAFVRSASLLQEPILFEDPTTGATHAQCYLDADTIVLECDEDGRGSATLAIREE